jgi:hypothetical protein
MVGGKNRKVSDACEGADFEHLIVLRDGSVASSDEAEPERSGRAPQQFTSWHRLLHDYLHPLRSECGPQKNLTDPTRYYDPQYYEAAIR